MHMSRLGFAVAHCVSQHSPSPLSSPSPPSSGSGSTGRCDSVTASTISAQSPTGSSHTACFSALRHLSNTRATVTALSGTNRVCLYPTHTPWSFCRESRHTTQRVHYLHTITWAVKPVPDLFFFHSVQPHYSAVRDTLRRKVNSSINADV